SSQATTAPRAAPSSRPRTRVGTAENSMTCILPRGSDTSREHPPATTNPSTAWTNGLHNAHDRMQTCIVRNMAVAKRDPQVQALARGLEILDLLLEAGGPVTGGELARRVGLHESSVSRLLQTLIRSGYVSRVAGGNVPALRMLRFSRVTGAFPMIGRVRPVLERIAADHPQHHVNLCAYGQCDVTHLVRCQTGTDTITGFSFPLHRSSAAMRHLADLPDDEALAALRSSRTRY